jgi:GPH family glycoside/pentoside/hexuronide:cation symporter
MKDSTDPDPTPQSSKEQAPGRDRLTKSQKIVYGMGTANDMWGNWLYPSIVWPVFNIFLHVNPALISTALMINRLVDALSDPLFGWLSDNTRTRFGRRRPYILVGSILAGLFFPVLFFVPTDWSDMSYFWFMILTSSVYITFVSCFNMPYQSLGNELTPDYNERTSVYAYRGAIQKVPEMAMFFAAAFITLSIFNDPETGEPNSLRGAQVYSTILGVCMIGIGLLIFLTLKERYYSAIVSRKTQTVSFTETIWKALKCRPFRAQLAMALAYGIGTSMVGTLGYYTTVYYVCNGDVALGSKWNFAMGLSNLAFGLMGVPFFAYIANRFGKRRAMMWVQCSAIVVFGLTWFLYNPNHPWMQLFAAGFIAFTQAAFWMLFGSIGADVIDYDELETGKRREGAFAACGTYIMKIGLAIGAGGSGFILGMTGFLAELGPDQSERTLDLMRFYLAVIPITGLLLALFALKRFGLTRERSMEIRKALEERRGTV